jgi:hypothetical protein
VYLDSVRVRRNNVPAKEGGGVSTEAAETRAAQPHGCDPRLSLRLRPTLALLAVLASTAAMKNFGFYDRLAFLFMLAAVGLMLWACLGRERVWQLSDSWARLPILLGALTLAGLLVQPVLAGNIWAAIAGVGGLVAGGLGLVRRWRPYSVAAALLAACTLILSGQAVLTTHLLYAEVPAAVRVVEWAALCGFLLCLSLLADVHWPGGRAPGFRSRLVLLFVSGAVLRGATLFAAPNPIIDVFVWLRDAPQHVLHGENPYAAEFANVYASDPAKLRLASYPPQPLLLALPLTAAGLDVRWANVACSLAAALALFLTAQSRGIPLLGALAAGAYLHLPLTPFLMEQAWYEPMLAAALGFGLVLAGRGRRWGFVVLAFGMTGKQYGVALLPPLWRAWRRQTRLLLFGLGAVLVGVFLPFLLWGPSDFLDMILLRHLQAGTSGGLTLQSALGDLFGVSLAQPVLWLAAFALIGLITWRTPRADSCPPGAALWTGAALLVFIPFHQAGFFNYYHLCTYLILLGATAFV